MNEHRKKTPDDILKSLAAASVQVGFGVSLYRLAQTPAFTDGVRRFLETRRSYVDTSPLGTLLRRIIPPVAGESPFRAFVSDPTTLLHSSALSIPDVPAVPLTVNYTRLSRTKARIMALRGRHATGLHPFMAATNPDYAFLAFAVDDAIASPAVKPATRAALATRTYTRRRLFTALESDPEFFRLFNLRWNRYLQSSGTGIPDPARPGVSISAYALVENYATILRLTSPGARFGEDRVQFDINKMLAYNAYVLRGFSPIRPAMLDPHFISGLRSATRPSQVSIGSYISEPGHLPASMDAMAFFEMLKPGRLESGFRQPSAMTRMSLGSVARIEKLLQAKFESLASESNPHRSILDSSVSTRIIRTSSGHNIANIDVEIRTFNPELPIRFSLPVPIVGRSGTFVTEAAGLSRGGFVRVDSGQLLNVTQMIEASVRTMLDKISSAAAEPIRGQSEVQRLVRRLVSDVTTQSVVMHGQFRDVSRLGTYKDNVISVVTGSAAPYGIRRARSIVPDFNVASRQILNHRRMQREGRGYSVIDLEWDFDNAAGSQHSWRDRNTRVYRATVIKYDPATGKKAIHEFVINPESYSHVKMKGFMNEGFIRTQGINPDELWNNLVKNGRDWKTVIPEIVKLIGDDFVITQNGTIADLPLLQRTFQSIAPENRWYYHERSIDVLPIFRFLMPFEDSRKLTSLGRKVLLGGNWMGTASELHQKYLSEFAMEASGGDTEITELVKRKYGEFFPTRILPEGFAHHNPSYDVTLTLALYEHLAQMQLGRSEVITGDQLSEMERVARSGSVNEKIQLLAGFSGVSSNELEGISDLFGTSASSGSKSARSLISATSLLPYSLYGNLVRNRPQLLSYLFAHPRSSLQLTGKRFSKRHKLGAAADRIEFGMDFLEPLVTRHMAVAEELTGIHNLPPVVHVVYRQNRWTATGGTRVSSAWAKLHYARRNVTIRAKVSPEAIRDGLDAISSKRTGQRLAPFSVLAQGVTDAYIESHDETTGKITRKKVRVDADGALRWTPDIEQVMVRGKVDAQGSKFHKGVIVGISTEDEFFKTGELTWQISHAESVNMGDKLAGASKGQIIGIERTKALGLLVSHRAMRGMHHPPPKTMLHAETYGKFQGRGEMGEWMLAQASVALHPLTWLEDNVSSRTRVTPGIYNIGSFGNVLRNSAGENIVVNSDYANALRRMKSLHGGRISFRVVRDPISTVRGSGPVRRLRFEIDPFQTVAEYLQAHPPTLEYLSEVHKLAGNVWTANDMKDPRITPAIEEFKANYTAVVRKQALEIANPSERLMFERQAEKDYKDFFEPRIGNPKMVQTVENSEQTQLRLETVGLRRLGLSGQSPRDNFRIYSYDSILKTPLGLRRGLRMRETDILYGTDEHLRNAIAANAKRLGYGPQHQPFRNIMESFTANLESLKNSGKWHVTTPAEFIEGLKPILESSHLRELITRPGTTAPQLGVIASQLGLSDISTAIHKGEITVEQAQTRIGGYIDRLTPRITRRSNSTEYLDRPLHKIHGSDFFESILHPNSSHWKKADGKLGIVVDLTEIKNLIGDNLLAPWRNPNITREMADVLGKIQGTDTHIFIPHPLVIGGYDQKRGGMFHLNKLQREMLSVSEALKAIITKGAAVTAEDRDALSHHLRAFQTGLMSSFSYAGQYGRAAGTMYMPGIQTVALPAELFAEKFNRVWGGVDFKGSPIKQIKVGLFTGFMFSDQASRLFGKEWEKFATLNPTDELNPHLRYFMMELHRPPDKITTSRLPIKMYVLDKKFAKRMKKVHQDLASRKLVMIDGFSAAAVGGDFDFDQYMFQAFDLEDLQNNVAVSRETLIADSKFDAEGRKVWIRGSEVAPDAAKLVGREVLPVDPNMNLDIMLRQRNAPTTARDLLEKIQLGRDQLLSSKMHIPSMTLVGFNVRDALLRRANISAETLSQWKEYSDDMKNMFHRYTSRYIDLKRDTKGADLAFITDQALHEAIVNSNDKQMISILGREEIAETGRRRAEALGFSGQEDYNFKQGMDILRVYRRAMQEGVASGQSLTSDRTIAALRLVFQGKTVPTEEGLYGMLREIGATGDIGPEAHLGMRESGRVLADALRVQRELVHAPVISATSMKKAGILGGAFLAMSLLRANQVEGGLFSLVNVGHMPGEGGERNAWIAKRKYSPIYIPENSTRIVQYNPAYQDKMQEYNAQFYGLPTKPPITLRESRNFLSRSYRTF